MKELKLYQQLFIYFIPIVSNLGFVNILVVCVRLWFFRKRLDEIGNPPFDFMMVWIRN